MNYIVEYFLPREKTEGWQSFHGMPTLRSARNDCRTLLEMTSGAVATRVLRSDGRVFGIGR